MIFLDEPTSGLDSYTAYSCVKLLRTVASYNATVLCTIHQPSSEIFFLFDLIVFMNRGKILFQGPVSEVIPTFSKAGESTTRLEVVSVMTKDWSRLSLSRELQPVRLCHVFDPN